MCNLTALEGICIVCFIAISVMIYQIKKDYDNKNYL